MSVATAAAWSDKAGVWQAKTAAIHMDSRACMYICMCVNHFVASTLRVCGRLNAYSAIFPGGLCAQQQQQTHHETNYTNNSATALKSSMPHNKRNMNACCSHCGVGVWRVVALRCMYYRLQLCTTLTSSVIVVIISIVRPSAILPLL